MGRKKGKRKMAIKRIISLFAAAMIIITSAALISCGNVEVETEPEETTEEVSETEVYNEPVDPLTGHSGYGEEYENSKPIGIVVENHPQARPQWGFTTPDIVFEYEVEGGISRMLWLYSNTDEVPDMVGPVRSARHDVVELALGMDMLFVHCGGSDIALNMINKYSGVISEIEAMTYENCFIRDNTRAVSREHTLVLIGDKFRQSVKELGLKTEINPEYKDPFLFESENAPRMLAGEDCQKVHFEYSNSYIYNFNYDEALNKYIPSIGGAVCSDENGNQCAYTNVLILYVDMIDLRDSSGHQDLALENGGSGVYISGGKRENISWTKGEDTDRLQLFSADGSPLTLNAGNSYIGFVRSTQQGKTTF